MGDDWDDDVPVKASTASFKKPSNDDWDDAPSSKPAQSDNSWKNKAATSSNNDGWDDDPKPSNNRQNGMSENKAGGWDDEPRNTNNGGWNDAPSSSNNGGFGGGGGGRGPRKPDWICNSCSATVFGSRDSCFKCNEPKGDAQDAPPRTDDGGRRGGRASDWICNSCSAKVFGSRDSCFKCNEPKGDAKDAPPDDGNSRGGRGGRASDWICNSCSAKVFGSRDSCFKCNEPKGDAKDAPPDDGNSRGGRSGRPNDWICDGCGAKVFGSKDTCFKCDEPKGDSKDAPAGDGGGNDWGNGGGGDKREPRGKKPGDWECVCGHSNFASRDKCQKCNEDKPESNGDDPQFNGTVVKEFYIPEETSENDLFSNQMQSGINFNKYANIPVKVNDPSRSSAPKPIDSFEEANLGNLLLENIKRCGYKTPTPIQKNGIPIILNNRDMMACAQTGSGKTAAFLLPMIHRMMKDQISTVVGQPCALIITPTRELTIQIYDEARKFAKDSIIKCGLVYGGTATRHQHNRINEGVHILVATPGRLLDFVDKTYITFERLKYLVLDEADRMLDMGFKESIQRVIDHPTMVPAKERQTLMFSATFPNEIQRLAGNYLNDYIFVTIGVIGGACTDVQQNIIQTTKFEKRDKLMSILDSTDPVGTIVFVETKRTADFLASFLSESKHPTTSIHGDRKQGQREQALRDFKNGSMKVIIATSVAARGLDIPNVRHVINYDFPKSIDEYVHRIGRTGRLGNQGKATSFYDAQQDGEIVTSLVVILKDAKQTVPDFLEMGGGGGGDGGHRNFGGSDFRQTVKPQAHGGAAEDEEW